MTSKNNFIPVIFLLGIFLSSFISSTKFTDSFALPKYFAIYLFVLVFLLVFCFTSLKQKYKSKLSITLLDIALLSFTIYQMLRAILTLHFSFTNDNLWLLLISGIIYFAVKPYFANTAENQNTIYFLSVVLIIIGFLQSCYGILQYLDVLPRLQDEFKIGGAYGNPGPYANFLVLLFPFVLVHILYRKGGKPIYYLSIITLVLMFIVLLLTKARSSWVAIAIVVTYVLFSHPAVKRFVQKWMAKLWIKITALLLIVFLLFNIAVFLYQYKEQSSSGRLFIWKVSMQMIADRPIFGFGYDKFAVEHNNYQANYFATNSDAKEEKEIADSVKYAFNDYIQIATETGLIGLILFIGLIFFSFFKGCKNERDDNKQNNLLISSRSSLLAILTTAMFSYPLRTIPIYMALFLFFSIVSTAFSHKVMEITFSKNRRKFLSIVGIGLIIVFSVNQAKKFQASKEWAKAFKLLRQGDYEIAMKVYDSLYPTLKYNNFFLFNYGAELSVLGQFQKSVDLLKEAEANLNDIDLYIYLGNSYVGLGEYENAASCFTKASLIMPVKFYPKYRLVKIYQETHQNEKAINLAREIVNMPVKVPSDIITNIKKEMQELLDSQELLRMQH